MLARAEFTETPTSYTTQPWLWIRWAGLVLIFALELQLFTLWFDTQPLYGIDRWWATVLGNSPAVLNAILAAVAVFLVAIFPRRQPLLGTLRQQCWQHRWWPWLASHLVTAGSFALLTRLLFVAHADTIPFVALWSSCWIGLGLCTFALWLLAVAPARFWSQFIRQEVAVLLVAGLVGTGTWVSGQLTQEFWRPLAAATFWVVRNLLGLLYADIVLQPEKQIVGTSTFKVAIDPACSGYEGIGLIVLLLAMYLWLFRSQLRFPQVLILLPVGMLTIWVANAIRITTLIVIGSSISPTVATGGFHSQAGWISFLLIGLGFIAGAHRFPFFSTAPPVPPAVKHTALAAALLMPLLTLMTSMMVTTALSSGFDWLYPVRVVAVGAVLWSFREAYRQLDWSWSWVGVGIGIVVFVVWMLLEPTGTSGTVAIPDEVIHLSGSWGLVWVFFRVVGSVITVPIAEELAFRGYVIRKLIANDFDTIRPGQFSWFSFLLSSVLFGFLHGRWLAGTLAGMGYALALYYRGRLADAVIAHMTTNGLIAACVLLWNWWSLWS
jgi:exosortase E/protease (VPEID-CTERM system)